MKKEDGLYPGWDPGQLDPVGWHPGRILAASSLEGLVSGGAKAGPEILVSGRAGALVSGRTTVSVRSLSQPDSLSPVGTTVPGAARPGIMVSGRAGGLVSGRTTVSVRSLSQPGGLSPDRTTVPGLARPKTLTSSFNLIPTIHHLRQERLRHLISHASLRNSSLGSSVSSGTNSGSSLGSGSGGGPGDWSGGASDSSSEVQDFSLLLSQLDLSTGSSPINIQKIN